jgi:hypothetical protein
MRILKVRERVVVSGRSAPLAYPTGELYPANSMGFRSALYYPHTELRGAGAEELWKQALLLWDNLHCIHPWEGFDPFHEATDFDQAWQVIGVPHVPTESEMEATHEEMEELVTRPRLPELFTFQSSSRPYEMYPQKLLGKTWQMLTEMGMKGELLADGDYPVSQATGQALMGILADQCAGTTKVRVTNRGDSYIALAKLLEETDPRPAEEAAVRGELVTITLEVLNLQDVPLQRLVEYRKREDGKEGPKLRGLRHHYLDKINEHVDQIVDPRRTAGDREELKRLFSVEVKDCVEQLRAELKADTKEFLLSKEFLGSAAVGVGAALVSGGLLPVVGAVATSFTTAAGSAVSLGGILGTKGKYAARRAKILESNPMAYLYHSQRGLIV